ncbi:MAG: hypothetical protein QW279_04890 [Candidatus Jordarchaeaceae archaeon]
MPNPRKKRKKTLRGKGSENDSRDKEAEWLEYLELEDEEFGW